MEEELDPEVIKATQISLGKYIKRPPLTEKLLKKPPFRFLHDIITTVLNTTGFFEGLFDENELISDNVKDRESKILFLNKAITIISTTTGRTLLVKPSKIVAGQEPIKTNELLQCLAFALNNNLTSHEAVKKYKEAKKKPIENQLDLKTKDSNKPTKKRDDSKKKSSKSQNVTTSHKQKPGELLITKTDKEKSNDITQKKENGPEKNDSRNKNTQPKALSKRMTNETKFQSENKTLLNDNKYITSRAASNENVKLLENLNNEIINDENLGADNVELDNNEEIDNIKTCNKESDNISIQQMDLEYKQVDTLADIGTNIINHEITSDVKNAILKTSDEEINENISQKKRKSSLDLHKKPPQITHLNHAVVKSPANEVEGFIKPAVEPENNKHASTPIRNETNVVRSISVRPSSSRPGAPRPKEKFENLISDTDSHLLGKVNIIAEHEQNEEEDESSIIVSHEQESISVISKENVEDLNRPENEYGHLVQQILDSQKEFSQVTGKTEIEWQLGAQKAMVAQHQEVELLRYNIQALTRVTNPLGKLLDHIQEDVEVMRQELQQWSNIYEEISKEIHTENALSKDSLQPLHLKLKQLESEMQEKSEKINDLKILIYKNTSRIDKLLSNGNVQ